MDPVTDSPRVLGNRYEVGDLLGRGGMAEVHLGRDTRLGRVVAIKLLRTDLARDPVFQARFRREAQSAAALNHPAIVAVYDTGEEQLFDAAGNLVALPYIVMEYVEGRTLREMLHGGRPMDIGLALEVTSGVLSALEYSHRAGIVHRDIKPANVMLTPAGDVKVMDFGIARALADASATMTQTQAVIGTAQYLSPEQARGETVDARSDLYSAGCLLFELVTGRPPFVADSPVAVAYQHVREAPPRPSSLNPAIPEDLDRVLLHALSKDRERRYQTAAEFRTDVDNVRAGRRVLAPIPGAGQIAGAAPMPDPHAAATEYMGQQPSATRAMTNVEGAYGTSMLPGGPPGQQYDQYDQYGPGTASYPARRGEPQGGGGRGFGYVLLGLAVVAVFAVVAYLVSNVISGGSGAQKVKIPPVVGVKKDVATSTLQGLNLKVTTTTKESATVPVDIVLDQNPKDGTQVDAGTTVTLVISAGPSSVQVPDVTTQTQAAARKAIEDAGLKVGDIVTQDDPKTQKDRVIKTDPPALRSVAPGSTVTIYISSGQVQVPDVRGKSFDEASKLLNAQRFSVNQELQQSDQPEGTVLEQSLTPDSKVDAGSAITLKVATPAPPPPTDQGGGQPTDQPTPSGEPQPSGQPSPTP